jgi:uncharacterized protein (TIGR02453 family)
MLNKKTLDFLRELKLNNNKDWFHAEANQAKYQAARADIVQLAGKLIAAVQDFESDMGFKFLEPTKCITRINRDLRFSKDKTPYKTDYYIVINKDGKRSDSAFYYLHIEAESCDMGGGLYNPPAHLLQKIRQDIDYAPADWLDLLQAKDFAAAFPQGLEFSAALQKVPANYLPEHKAADLLKRKDFFTCARRDADFICSPEAVAEIAKVLAASRPLVDLLNRAISFED